MTATRVWDTWRYTEGGAYCLYSDGYHASMGGASGSVGPFGTETECLTALGVVRAEADGRHQAATKRNITPQVAVADEPVANCAQCGCETLRALLMTSSRGAVCPDCYEGDE
jgi:hypothetical protein